MPLSASSQPFKQFAEDVLDSKKSMRILYLMHVNWYWIRQRPHVFAEMLAEHHTLHLRHYAMYRRQHRVAESAPPGEARVLHRIPGRLQRFAASARALDEWLLSAQIGSDLRRLAPDVVWITHPALGVALEHLPAAAMPRVVYDCMDDYLAFDGIDTRAMAEYERRLLARADAALFSSLTLLRRVAARSKMQGTAHVVNNGVAQALIERAAMPMPVRAGSQEMVLGYFGTIARWFDWPLVLRLLEARPTARLRLAGPIEVAPPEHPRIEHVGVLAHADLRSFAAGCDLLVMPFVVDRLIEAVDPVKLYEYVAFARPALAPRYPETERFEPFVQLYEDAAGALAALDDLTLQSSHARLAFLQAHTWESRRSALLDAVGSSCPS